MKYYNYKLINLLNEETINSDDGKILGRIKTKKSIQSIYSDYDSLYLLEKDFSLKKYQINIILQE